MTNTAAFDRKSTALEVVAAHDLHGREAIVTGGASGIGVETVRALATAGARVVLAARDETQASEVAAALRRDDRRREIEVGASRPRLTRVGSRLRRSAFSRTGRPLHILINNAGVMATPLLVHPGRIRAAVRHQPHRPLRAHRRTAAGAEGGRHRARRRALVARPPPLRCRLRRPRFPNAALRALDRLRAVEDRQCALRRWPFDAPRRRRHHIPRRFAGRHHDRPAEARAARGADRHGLDRRGWHAESPLQEHRAGRRNLHLGRGLARSRWPWRQVP